MKVVILAGGFGTRISEESILRPKPMIEIGGKPILWHIMKLYSHYGYHEFIICCGYKQEIIKEWFANYYFNQNDITFDFAERNKIIIHSDVTEPWKVTLVDTGLNTMTGGRIKRIKDYVGDEPFMLTYGDGVADVDIKALVKAHEEKKTIGTITGIQPEGRFGILDMKDGLVQSFREKSQNDTGWINGGFMVFEPQIFDYIDGDETIFEREPLERVAKEKQLSVYKHYGFWKCMDTLRDKQKLEELINEGSAPWKVWE